mgnify:CR=1 FL=1
MYDIVIKNGLVYDGINTEPKRVDIAIERERIVYIGDLRDARADVIIDASKRVVAPGFIDMHSHSDTTILIYPDSSSKIRQGVTTEVVGNCGISMAPISKDRLELLMKFVDQYFPGLSYLLDWNWRSLKDYYKIVETVKPAVNLIPLVGHNTLRIAVMGFEARDPTDSELNIMKNMLEEEMQDGAWGLSTGLFYAPGSYARTEEVIELAKVVKRYGGIYASHIRDEAEGVLSAIEEAIRIGREAGVSVQISHIKAMGKAQWGLSTKIIEIINRARMDGLDVHADVYPYDAGQTALLQLLPDWAKEGGTDEALKRLMNNETAEKIRAEMEEGKMKGQNFVYELGWENIIIVATELGERDIEGKSIQEIASKDGKRPFDVFREILIRNHGNVSVMIRAMSEDDIVNFIKQDFIYIGSDQNGIRPGYGPLGGKQHPRAYGTFPRVIRRYVFEKGVISLGEAIAKMSGKPARRLGLKDRGMIKEDYYADIVIFDPERIADRATYLEPTLYPDGIEYVIVNGKIAVKNGYETGIRNGKILWKNKYAYA